MTDAVQEQQQAPQQQQDQQPAPAPEAAPLSDEAIMAKALGLDGRPRDERGRFVGQQQQQPQQPAPQETEAGPVEQKAEQQPAEQEQKAEEPKQEEVPWDSVKDLKIKVPMKQDGKEWVEELTVGQLREERMLKADYTRKTQEIAAKEREVRSQTQAAVEKERANYMVALQAMQESIAQAASPELANIDWNKLAAENPAEYVRLSNRARVVNEAIQRIRFEQEKVQSQQAKEREERLAQAVEESRTRIKEAIPDWNDDLYRKVLHRGIDTYGFKPDEVQSLYDHRILRVMHDAHQWRAMQEGKPLAEKKVVQVPPVLKPGNVKPKVDPQAQKAQADRNRLRANGNDQDAAAAVMAAFLK